MFILKNGPAKCFYNLLLPAREAHGAVVYLRIETLDGFQVKFLASKTRTSPLQLQTIPRLELLSALLLPHLISSVNKSLKSRLTIDSTICYTDSKVTSFWIKGVEKDWKQFVWNRTIEIRTLLPDATWKHCAGKDNPAELPSRGVSLAQLIYIWNNGLGC